MSAETPKQNDPPQAASPVRGYARAYEGRAPPWEIGRPQAAIVALAREGALAGRVLDVGCGTGEHALFFAARHQPACGIDTSELAIARARAKAAERGLSAMFEVQSALALDTLGAPFDAPFDAAVDVGVFHLFAPEQAALYAEGLASVLAPGCEFACLVVSDREPPDFGGPRAPRLVRRDDFERAFGATFRVASIDEARFETNLPAHAATGGACAWLARLRRL